MEGLARFRDELADFAELEPTTVVSPSPAPRTGRRALPAHLRTDPFSLRLTIEERMLVAEAAARAGAGAAATWARTALTAAARELLDAAAEGKAAHG